jgi:hypothetical protein
VWFVVEAANSTSTIHLDGHPDYTDNADEITPRARTLPIIASEFTFQISDYATLK